MCVHGKGYQTLFWIRLQSLRQLVEIAKLEKETFQMQFNYMGHIIILMP